MFKDPIVDVLGQAAVVFATSAIKLAAISEGFKIDFNDLPPDRQHAAIAQANLLNQAGRTFTTAGAKEIISAMTCLTPDAQLYAEKILLLVKDGLSLQSTDVIRSAIDHANSWQKAN